MEAVVLDKPRQIGIETIAEPALLAPADVLLRLTSTAICGTDLHIYEGRLGGGQRIVIGHEPLGVVERVGTGVVNVRVGDRVTVPTHICCGFCPNCVHGYSAQCLTTNPGKAGAAYGYPGMGGYTGAQTQLLRVPFGDANCLRLPGQPGDRWEHDFVLLADALPTAFHATELAGVRTGDIVVIYGAGAIGLLTAMCAFMRGALQVFVVDAIPERLDKAGELGAQPIDMRDGDTVERILEQIARQRSGIAWRGEEANLGATVCIDAIGFQAREGRGGPTRQLCHPLGNPFQEGCDDRHGPRRRQELQRSPARRDRERADQTRNHRLASASVTRRPRRIRKIRRAQRRLH